MTSTATLSSTDSATVSTPVGAPIIVALRGGDDSAVLRAGRFCSAYADGGVVAVLVLDTLPVYVGGEAAMLPAHFETDRAAACLATLDAQARDVGARTSWPARANCRGRDNTPDGTECKLSRAGSEQRRTIPLS